MQPPADKRPSRLLRIRLLAWLLFGGLVLSFFLLPNHKEISEWIERTRLAASVKPVLAEARFPNGRTPAQALFDLPLERLRSLAKLAHLAPREQLTRIFNSPGHLDYDPFIHAFTLAAIRDTHTLVPLEAAEIVVGKSPQIPDAQRLEVFGLLATNALVASQPELGCELLCHATRSQASTWHTVKDMIAMARRAGQQSKAMESFRLWMQKHRTSLAPDERRETLATQYSLALEANLPGESLEACLVEFQSEPSITNISPDLMERTHHAAVLADRTREILPWIESYLSSFREATLATRELIDAAHSNTYALWVKRAAEIADANGLGEKACAHHQRLFAMGDTSCLDRLLPLSEQLGHSEDTATLLQARAAKSKAGGYLLESARIAAANGKTTQAAGMYEEWIKTHPVDRDAAFELACMTERHGALEAGIGAFERFMRAFPGDVPGVKKLAKLRVQLGQPETALRELDNLREGDFDAATLESYTMLAESMDRPASLQRALRIASLDEKLTTPALYVRMADTARQLGTDDGAPVKILREGIARLPQSPSLRVKLASLLVELERHDEALAEALHPVVKDRFDAIMLVLAAAPHTSRCAEALAAAGAGFEKRHDLSVAERLDLAVVCCKAGDAARGEALFASVPAGRDNLARIAAARLLAGQFGKAELLARQNVAQNQSPQPADWILLGDARQKLGLLMEANDCYAKALSVTSRKIAAQNKRAPRPAAIDTPQPVTLQ